MKKQRLTTKFLSSDRFRPRRLEVITSNFFQNMSDGYICPVRETDNHVSIYISLLNNEKELLNYQVDQHLPLLNSHICLEFLSSPRNFNYILSWICWLELTHSRKFLSSDRCRHGCLGVITLNASATSYGSLVCFCFFFKMMVICPVRSGAYIWPRIDF